MGNCQANDAAAVVIQHPDGHAERLHRPTSADEVMKNHPGHYVAHLTLSISDDVRKTTSSTDTAAAVRFTRIRLLKHKEILLIGQIYRLITSNEVAKALRARKHEKIRKENELLKQQQVEIQHSLLQLFEQQNQTVQKNTSFEDDGEVTAQNDSQVLDLTSRHERERQRSTRNWRPSLHSISEIGS